MHQYPPTGLYGQTLLTGVLGAALYRGSEEPHLAPNQQTGLRLACNLCKHQPLRQWLQTHNAVLMDRFAPCCSSTNKAVRFAFATFMLNLAVFFNTTAKADTEGQAQVQFLWLTQLCCTLIHQHVFFRALQSHVQLFVHVYVPAVPLVVTFASSQAVIEGRTCSVAGPLSPCRVVGSHPTL